MKFFFSIWESAFVLLGLGVVATIDNADLLLTEFREYLACETICSEVALIERPSSNRDAKIRGRWTIVRYPTNSFGFSKCPVRKLGT